MKLLPCPCCGGKARVATSETKCAKCHAKQVLGISCTGCQLWLDQAVFKTPNDLIAAWNKRTRPRLFVIDDPKLQPSLN